MAAFARFGRWWELPQQRWYLKLWRNLHSEMTWVDALVGLSAIIIISLILIGFRYQIIPEYKVGQIADRDVRAVQDVTYEDRAATGIKRAEAIAGVPSLYQLDSDRIIVREKSISAAFSDARDILSENGIAPATKLVPAVEQELLKKLESRVGRIFPPDILPVFLRRNFDSELENRILKILDTVLRDGIISDRGQFLKDQRSGIMLRHSSFPLEYPLTDAFMARDLSAAKEFIRQSRRDFSGFSQRDQAAAIQFLETALFPTLLCNVGETESRRTQAASRIQPVEAQIKQGQIIVRRGEPITPNMLMQLSALINLRRPRSLIGQFGGYFLLASILVYSLWRYFVFYQSRHRRIRNHAALILTIIIIALLTIRLATALAEILGERFERFRDPSVLYYGIPFAFGALLTTLLVDVNLGVISSIILAILTGLFYGDIALAAYLMMGSMAGIYSIRQYKDRAAILKAGLTIGIVNILCLAGLGILRQMPMRWSDLLDQFVLALLSGILASTLASMLLPALETLFKITTDIRLLELSNLNAPMLRRMSVEAPGTYHHSLMVATLAESAAESIGANPLLARVAAYYHDIGKTLKPEYYVENQAYGANKHEELSPNASFIIILGHIKDGLQLAKECGLPRRIGDMIPQHHGTRVMTYFYQKAKNRLEGEGNGVMEADFRYAGPKPQSKEAAIMMMADSVEAASRTLDDPSPTQIERMINRLTEDIINDNQFDECDITLRDVKIVKSSFLKILTGIFHHRIDYPGYDFKRTEDVSKGIATQSPGPEPTTTV
jgi:cyclic-di-AMP phosphodiesterase PgpH